MMKKILLLLTVVLLFNNAQAQDYLGLSTGNYSGIQGVQLQPANVADNRYKFEINLLSTNIGFQNNYLGFSRDYFINNRFSFKDYDTYADFQSNVLKENSILGNNIDFNLSNRLNLPSLLLTTGKKSGIAIGLQSRTAIAVNNMNAQFAKQLYENFQFAPTYNQAYNLDNLSMNALNWFEGSFTYGRVLVDNGKHFLKAGATAKYLGGVSSWYLNVEDMDLTVNNDSTLSTAGNSVNYGHSPTDFSGQILRDYQPDASGFGFDAGLVYEFRGRINKFKILNLKGDSDDDFTTTRRDKNKYSFKAGVSLVDAGKLTFNSTPLARDFSSNVAGINIKNIGIKNVQDLDTFISNNVNYKDTVTGQAFSVAMPTALSAQFDLHLVKGFYVNAMAYVPFNSLNKDVDYRVFTPNYYAVTPRWESRLAGIYVPLVYNRTNNEKKELTAGATLRVGPAFVGTNNLLTLVQKDNIQSANVHLGFKIPVAHGKPSKAARMFQKFTNSKDEEPTIITTTDDGENVEPEIIKEKKEKIIEKEIKKEEKKQTPDVAPIQIIINNYNSAGNTPSNQRIIDLDPNTGEQTERTVIVNDTNNSTIYQNTERNNIQDNQELRSMQEQIEFLKFKLKQKEMMLDEVEKEQERFKNGSSNEESKKKIDSLKNEYLYNNQYEFNGAAWDSSSSVYDLRARMFELRKELLTIDNRSVALDRNISEIRRQNELEQQRTSNAAYAKNLEEIRAVLLDIQNQEKEIIQPAKVYYHDSPKIDYEQQEKTSTVSPNITKITPVVTKTQPTLNTTNYTITKMSIEDSLAIKKAKADKIVLQEELSAVRAELNAYKDAKPKRRWVLFGNNKNVETAAPAAVKVIRDTVVIEKPVERIVTKIVRDTITNTIEKNNIITKTETKVKKVEVDNTEARLLAMPAYFVLFDVGSADVKEIFRKELDYYAQQIEQYPALKINLTGHADASGNAQANLALSQRRAQQVRNYLVLKGVAREKISIDFDGDKDPLADNQTNVGKSQNRRVEVQLVK